MRWQSLVVLITIAVSAVAAPSLPLTIPCDRESMIGVLNVCHSVTPALSSNGDIPCVNERPYSHVLVSYVSCNESLNPVTTPMLFIKLSEHPPTA